MNLTNIKSSHLLLITIFLAVCSIKTSAQIIPSSADLSYLLNSGADISLTHKVVAKDKKKWVILSVTKKNRTVFDSLVFTYSFTDKLSDPLNNFIEAPLKNYVLYATETTNMYAFEPANNTYKFLVLSILNTTTNKSYTYIINLEKASSFFLSKTDLTIPILLNFSTKNSSIKIAKLEEQNTNFGVQFYSTKFSAAFPPMANLKSDSSFGKADTTFTISSNTTLPTTKEGVYSIFEENNEKLVSFFRISSSRYPQLSNINEIIEASIYLFTKREKEKLNTSPTPKKDYDSFWLENTNSSERAGKMISAYFSMVKEANILFTTFKEGWKTDMGMIYIIFGSPNKVFRADGSIVWAYNKTYELPNLTFEFFLKDENLDTEHFELERNIKYQNTWFRAIDLWRKGRKKL